MLKKVCGWEQGCFKTKYDFYSSLWSSKLEESVITFSLAKWNPLERNFLIPNLCPNAIWVPLSLVKEIYQEVNMLTSFHRLVCSLMLKLGIKWGMQKLRYLKIQNLNYIWEIIFRQTGCTIDSVSDNMHEQQGMPLHVSADTNRKQWFVAALSASL